MYEVNDKVFLVTGAASGIGAVVVRLLLENGAKHVAALDIDKERGLALETELKEKHGTNSMIFIECDITRQLDNAFDLAMKEFGYIDVVINNAGIMNDSPSLYLKEIAVNMTALITSSLKAYEWMRQDRGGKGGTIINISSIVGLMQTSLLPIYSATKSAVLQFSNCLGMEENYKASGVRVLTVCYGSTDTSLLDEKKFDGFTEEIKETMHLTIKQLPQQSTQSAAKGLLAVYRNGSSGSTWLVTSNREAEDITQNVQDAYKILIKSWIKRNARHASERGGVFALSGECQYRCTSLDACIAPALWCDGVVQCPQGEDERLSECSALLRVPAHYDVALLAFTILAIFAVIAAARLPPTFCLAAPSQELIVRHGNLRREGSDLLTKRRLRALREVDRVTTV